MDVDWNLKNEDDHKNQNNLKNENNKKIYKSGILLALHFHKLTYKPIFIYDDELALLAKLNIQKGHF